MLVIGRKTKGKIFIGPDIIIEVCHIGRDTVKIGIIAPLDIQIVRDDAKDLTQKERK